MATLYDTKPWREFRARVREDAECHLSGIAGECRGTLHVHHIEPLSTGGVELPGEEGVVVLCAAHHRMVDSFLKRRRRWKTCPHKHRTLEARRQCEKRLNAEAA